MKTYEVAGSKNIIHSVNNYCTFWARPSSENFYYCATAKEFFQGNEDSLKGILNNLEIATTSAFTSLAKYQYKMK